MMRKLVCAGTILALAVGFGFAEEFRAIISKVDGNKITFSETKGKGQKGEEKTLPVADNVKILKGKFNPETKKVDAGDALESGLKNEVFTKIDEKGVRATIITDSENKKIVEIRVGGGRGKKN